MKKIKNLVIALFLAFTFIVADLAAAPVTAQAAGTLKFAKSITMLKGNQTGYGIMNSVKSDQILNLKCSNTNVATVKKEKFIDDYTITIKAKKQGTATVSFTVKRKNGKKYSFKSKISVYNYTNPLNKCVVGKKDYKKQLDKKNTVTVSSSSPKKGKINITAKKGYKIEAIYYSEYGTGVQKKIKNGSTITLDSQHYLQIIYKDTRKNYSYAVSLYGSL